VTTTAERNGAPTTALDFVARPHRLFIGGEWVSTASSLDSIDPATGKVLCQVPLATVDHVDQAVTAALGALRTWRRTPASARARMLWKLGDLVDRIADELAALEVLDNGKPLGEASAVDVPLTADIFRYFAGCANGLEGSVVPNAASDMLTLSTREPIGVVAAITPWNFPLLEVAYKLGPALAAGCTVVVKPSELTALSTLRLMELVVDAGFPPGVVNVVIGGPDIGDALATHRAVAKIAFTGQTATGRQILRAAADRLTPVSLELGGKSPNIVFADGDLGAATGGVFGGIFFNQGQACVAGSRLLVEASVADRVVEDVVARAGRIRLGDGFDPDTTMGPVISAAHRGGILSMIDGAVADGAEVAIGGRPGAVDGLDGYFVEPTVLTGVTSAMNVAQEEVFGPVLSVLPWEDPDELVALANDVPYGIAAGIWTADVARALRIAQDLEVGTVWINTYGMFDVAVPFGGRKQSGTGRELGKSALDPYLVSKSIWVDLQPAAQTAGQAVAR